MEVKEIIKARRLELHLSQLEVARYVGVSEATVSRWESGDIANMGASRISLLCEILSLNPIDIVNPGHTENAPAALNPELLDLLEEYRTRPEMKLLFSVTKNARPESIRRAAAIVEALEKEERGED